MRLLVACAMVVAALAFPSDVTAEQRWFDRGALPPGLVVGTGEQPLRLAVSSTVVGVSSAPAADGQEAGVEAKRSTESGMTLLTVASKIDRQLKYDLYISPDGEHFLYTSTCALLPKATNFESWPATIHSFAIGNVRVATAHACD